ncbi:phage terminase large subunit [uncultured Jatrophihabitans sp.]|uniref:phage terminase large subunit n=1 Tax=uncultured Jatrophihabitans sp. TaxID=1610747 RepID=UPI0035CC1681
MTTFFDRLADRMETITLGNWNSPGQVARVLDPNTVQTPALDVIDRQLVRVADGEITRLIITMPPQEGKSERGSRRFPTYLLKRNPELRLGLASYEFTIARRLGRAVRSDIQTHGRDLELAISRDTAAANEWTLAGHRGGVYSVGIGGALTGRPIDGLIIDDPIKDRAQAESEAYRKAVWEWWTDVARTRLSPGAFVVLILTRWHEDDLAGRLLANNVEGWELVNIPALANHDPAKGEVDLLGREPGEWLESARGRTPEQWQQIRASVGERTFASLYQGRPAPVEGDMFKRAHWVRYDQPRAVLRDDGTWHCPGADEVIQSWDMAFKDTKASDYVVGQVWARFGLDAVLLDQVRDRMSFSRTLDAVREMTSRWPQALRKLVEDKANGPAVINQLQSTVTGLVPVDPGRDSKTARAIAVTPFVESRHVLIPTERLASWVEGFVEEAAAFPNVTHDDQVDAATQALTRLLGGNRGPTQMASPAVLAGLGSIPNIPMRLPR